MFANSRGVCEGVSPPVRLVLLLTIVVTLALVWWDIVGLVM